MHQNIHELSFTGITEDELVAFEILDDENREFNEFKNVLSNKTKYLVTYKAIFTKKYVEALKINIPVLSIESFFDVNKTQTPVKSNNYSFGETQKCSNIKRISKFEHSVFSTSGISNPIYANYFILQGAKFDPSCNLFLDFLICEGSTSEKYIFCKNNNIPIIRTEDVFKNNFEIFLKEQTHIAHETQGGGIFENKTFYIDENLPPKLFNALKRMILTHEGMRFSTMSNNVDYIISFSNNVDAYAEWDNVLHYQFIFDCIKSNVLLHENAYIIHRKHDLVIFNNCVIYIDKPSLMENMEDKENVTNDLTNEYAESYFVELENKIKALGGILQESIDMRTTHVVTSKNKEDKQYHCVTPNFIDDCMMYLKHFNEDKYKPRKSIFRKRKICKVQFTGLEETKKNNIIDILNKHSIPYVNSDKFCKCTHLIMQNFSTTEKLFGALVSGAWIIRPEYFMDERINNMTIMNNPEILENYEWVPDIKHNNSTNNKIISAIKKWRIKIQSGGHKPFYRWNVKLYASSKKYELYAGMIINGGGRMTENENYTHVFYDKSYRGEIKESTKISVSNIFEYLTK